MVITHGGRLTTSEPSVEVRTWLPARIPAPGKRTQPRIAPSPAPVPPESPARTLSAIRLRLKLVMAAAFTISAALQLQDPELDADMALVVGRRVGDEIDRQIEAIDRVIAKLPGARGREAPR